MIRLACRRGDGRKLRLSEHGRRGLAGDGRRAFRLNHTGLPLPRSKTTTPDQRGFDRASRSARARWSLRSVRALAMAVARLRRGQDQHLLVGARDLEPAPSSPRGRSCRRARPGSGIGVHCSAFGGINSNEKPSPRT